MGITKTDIFTKEQNALALTYKVLAHPARIAILQYISKQQDCICSTITQEIGLSQATISQHLKELKKIGLIQGTIQGKKMCYCIDTKNWEQLQKQTALFFTGIAPTCCM